MPHLEFIDGREPPLFYSSIFPRLQMTMTSLPTPQYLGHAEIALQSRKNDKAKSGTACATPGNKISKRPTLTLMQNSGDRPDVATVAILGYN